MPLFEARHKLTFEDMLEFLKEDFFQISFALPMRISTLAVRKAGAMAEKASFPSTKKIA